MRRWGRLSGWLLLLVPMLPVRSVFGEIEGSTGLVPPAEWLLGLFIFGVAALFVGRLIPSGSPSAALEFLGREGPRRSLLTVACFVALAALLVAVSRTAFGGRPLLIDSVVQVFQARIFAAGSAWAPAPERPAFFAVQHMVVDGDRWYSQYPPGHAGLLTLGVRVGATWLVPVLLSLGTAGLLYGFARRAYDLRTARLTLLVLVAAPFFWFMGASHMNHVSALFFVSAALFLVATWEDTERDVHLFLAGLALGGALLCRPLTALAAGGALAIPVLTTAWRRRLWTGLGAGALGAVLGATAYLAWNAATTGDPFLTGYVKLWGESHGLGFHPTPWGGEHTPVAGIGNQLTDLSLLAAFAFEWPLPALLPAGLLFAAGWATRRWDHRLLAGLLAVPIAYVFYWHRDAFLGPRYLYSGLAFLAPLTARGVIEVVDRLRGRVVWAGTALTKVAADSVLAAAVALCVAYAALYAVPRRWHVYRTGLSSMKIDLPDRAATAGIGRALVFVPVSWGNRLLARMRGAGISASVAERTYRTADHCALELVISRAERQAWTPSRLADALKQLPAVDRRLGASSPNRDPTLRLGGGPLDPRCAAQLSVDSLGYGNFSPFLADQDPFLAGPLIIARDLGDRNTELRGSHPDRAAWIFRNGEFTSEDSAVD